MVDTLARAAATGLTTERAWRERLVGALHLVTSLVLAVGYLVPALLLVSVIVAVSLAVVRATAIALDLRGAILPFALPESARLSDLVVMIVAFPSAATVLGRLTCWIQRNRVRSVFGLVETRAPEASTSPSGLIRAVSFLYGRDAWVAVVHSTLIGIQGVIGGGLTVGLLVNGIAVTIGALLAFGFAVFAGSTAGASIPLISLVLGPIAILLGVWLVSPLVWVERWLTRKLLFDAPEVRMRRRLLQVTHSRSRMVDVAEAERRRIERDLHDGAQQRLLTVTMTLSRARAKFDHDPQQARTLLDEARTEAKTVMAELREVARGLHPKVLTDHGLGSALPVAAERCPVPVNLDVWLPQRPSSRAEGVAYYVACEALSNIAKHAHATSVSMNIARIAHAGADSLRLTVTDDGEGGADPDTGSGLYGLWDRVNAVDGTLTVHSPEREGTVLTADIPWEA